MAGKFYMAAWLWPAAMLVFAGPVLAQGKDGIASADDARSVLARFARMDAEMTYCAALTHDEVIFNTAHEEWLKRNLYLREMAFDILTYRKASADEQALAAAARSNVTADYAKVNDEATACRKVVSDIWSGDADIETTDPDLARLIYQSIQTLDAKQPDSTAAPG